jgi:hypothetical protein
MTRVEMNRGLVSVCKEGEVRRRRRRREDRGLACREQGAGTGTGAGAGAGAAELEQRASNKEPATGMAMLWVGAGCRCLRSC